MGLVLFLYRAYLDHPDDAPMERGLADFRPLTASQRKTGKFFIVVALVFLASQGAGAIMAHSYYERETFYGIQLNYILPFNFLRSFHTQAPIIWIGLGWIASGLFIAPAIAGGREAKGQGFLVDLLFWVSLFVVAAALTGNYLGIQGVIDKGWFWFGNQGLSYIQLGRFWQICFFAALPPGASSCSVRCGRRATRLGGDPAVLDGQDPARASDLGIDGQRRRALCLRHDPADRDREDRSRSPTSGAGGWSISGSSNRSNSSRSRSAPIC